MILCTTAVLLASFAASFAWSHYNLRTVLDVRNDQFLRHKLAEMESLVRDRSVAAPGSALEAEIRHEAEVHAEAGYVVVLRRRGSVRVLPDSEGNQEFAREFPALPGEAVPFTVAVPGQAWPYRVVRSTLTIPGEGECTVELGLRLQETYETLASFDRRVAVGGAAFFVVAVLGGLFLTRQALVPVSESVRKARELSPQDLSARLPRSGAGDELDLLAATINEMLDRLAGYHDSIIRFTADASHELRGPLAAMRAAVEIALQQTRSAEDYRETLENLGEQGQHLTDLVNKLLLLAKADAGEVQLQRETVDLTTLVTETVEMYQPLADERKLTLHWNAGPPVSVHGDRLRLGQLITNLLDNAVKFTESGGTVELRLNSSGETAGLTVADTGTGIPSDRLPHIFERFYQGDESRSGKGCGLGLSICRWVVDAHGGSIAVMSRIGQGTEFTVDLPKI